MAAVPGGVRGTGEKVLRPAGAITYGKPGRCDGNVEKIKKTCWLDR